MTHPYRENMFQGDSDVVNRLLSKLEGLPVASWRKEKDSRGDYRVMLGVRTLAVSKNGAFFFLGTCKSTWQGIKTIVSQRERIEELYCTIEEGKKNQSERELHQKLVELVDSL